MKKRFGKIENGELMIAPDSLQDDKFTYFNPKNEKYIEFGYQEIISDKFPEDRVSRYRAKYKQQDGYILETWEIDDSEIESDNTESLEARIQVLEEQIAFLMEYGNFRKPWQEHRKN